MAYPPTGNPRVFGPGRARPIDRVLIWLGGGAVAIWVLWTARIGEGYDIWPGFAELSRWDVALYAVLAMILGVSGCFAATYPPQKIIVRVDDHGLTLRSLRPYDRARTFMPFALLDTVTVSRIPKSTDLSVQIEMRRGARWRSCAFAARSATRGRGLVIAREIAARAAAAGMTVTPPKGPGWTRGKMLWRFEARADKAEDGTP